MRRLKAFGAFWYDFVIGDDWLIAAGVVVALTITALVGTTGVAGWWIVPVAIVILLPLSLWRATRQS
jgi:hypothetical protein